MQNSNPEIGKSIQAAGWQTNILDKGQGHPVMLLHGSGPGVTAWANWRTVIAGLSEQRRVIAPDILGFGFSEQPAGQHYNKATWVEHVIGVMDALDLPQVDLLGNSFGGGLALAVALKHPRRVRRLVLMGSVGVKFPLTEGLDAVWGYQPSPDNMKALLKRFVYDSNMVNDELVESRYQASIRPHCQAAFAAMFPAPRQQWIDMLSSPTQSIRALPHETLIIHGREDAVIPAKVSEDLFSLLPNAQLHVFGKCGHWTQIEHPDRFLGLVNPFLQEADKTMNVGLQNE